MASKPQLEKLATVTSGLLFPTEGHVENSCCSLGPCSHPPQAPLAGPPGSTHCVAICKCVSSVVCTCAHIGGTEKVLSGSLESGFLLKMIGHSLPTLLSSCSASLAFHVPHSNSSALQQPSLGLEVFWTDLHLHPFEGVVGSMPAVPSDAIHMCLVLPQAVVHPIEVGIRAAVVPVATWHEKHMRLAAGMAP